MDYIHKIEMVQRRAARVVTNRYRNTSSVTSMNEHLEWESLEARRAKHQLTMLFKIIQVLVDTPANEYLTPASNRTRSQHSLKFKQIPNSSDTTNLASSLALFVTGTLYQPMWLKLPVWYPLNGSSPLYPFRLLGPVTQVALMRSLSGAGGDFVCPGAATGSQIG